MRSHLAATVVSILASIASTSFAFAEAEVRSRACGIMKADELLRRSYSFDRSKPGAAGPVEAEANLIKAEGTPTLNALTGTNARPSIQQTPSDGQLLLVIKRPQEISAKDWTGAYVYGAAQTEEKSPSGDAASIVPIGVSIKDRSNDQVLLDITVPKGRQGYDAEKWLLVAAMCGGDRNEVLSYAAAKVKIVSTTYAASLTLLFLIIFWLSIAYATWQFYQDKLNKIWDDDKELLIRRYYGKSRFARTAWIAGQSLNPLFISQDSLGFASLARLQILLFTTVVGGMLLYVFIHSGVLSELSETILITLGITLAGSTFGRAVGDWVGIKPENRQWLMGNNLIKPQIDRPRWSDLFSSQGEIDVAKVQAFLFTALIAVSIVVKGASGLDAFTVPAQVLYLSGISQLAYVAGRIVPSETKQKIDQDIDALRAAAEDFNNYKDDDVRRNKFRLTRAAARKTLNQTYGDKFDSASFDAMAGTESKKLEDTATDYPTTTI